MSAAVVPAVSIVIPTRDRRDSLARCLNAVAALKYPGDVQTVVVDDSGADPLEPSLEATRSTLDPLVIRTGGRGPAAARNAGALGASAELLAFLDDDCAPRPDWLELLVARVAGQTNRAAGGRSVNALPDNRYAAASQAIDDAVHECYAGSGPVTFLSSSNLVAGADAFSRVGGFDERFPAPGGEDRDFCHRWIEAGGDLALEPRALVDHAHDLSLASFLRQHHSYGRGAWTARRTQTERAGGRLDMSTARSGGIVRAARRSLAGSGPGAPALIAGWRAATWSGVARQAAADLFRRTRAR